jgi:hypothetical protein
MSGFDPSKFLAPELSLDGGAPAPLPAEPVERDPVEPVAGVAATRRNDDGLLIDEETGEILDGWAAGGGSVAAVAGVAATHDLPLTAPFARELNAMFSYPEPDWMKRGSWKRLCEAIRKFTETKAADALAKGWEPIELFGVYREPWRRSLAVDGVLWLAHGRAIGAVEAHAIEIINMHPPHNRAYRAHFMTQRVRSLLMWEAFHPSNRRPDDYGYR